VVLLVWFLDQPTDVMASSDTVMKNGGNTEEVAEDEPCIGETSGQNRPPPVRSQLSVAQRARQRWQRAVGLLLFDICT